MATRNVLTNTYDFDFKNLGLTGALTGWNDQLMQRLAGHEYLKRDGAEQEPMGADAIRCTVRLVFIGADWSARYRALIVAVRKDPSGLLVHPLLGKLNVAAKVIGGAVDLEKAKDTIAVTVEFVEDNLDSALAAAAIQTIASANGAVTTQTTALTSSMSAGGYGTGAVSASAALVSQALAYASLAVSVGYGTLVDTSLDTRLVAIGVQTAAAAAALLADPKNKTSADCFAALALQEQVYAACIDLDAAIASRKPPIVAVTVQSQQSLVAFLQAFYLGDDILARLDEAQTLNRVPNPFAVPPGTVLQLYSPVS